MRTPLSAEELERVKAAFIRVDKDNSCTLDGLELRALFLELGRFDLDPDVEVDNIRRIGCEPTRCHSPARWRRARHALATPRPLESEETERPSLSRRALVTPRYRRRVKGKDNRITAEDRLDLRATIKFFELHPRPAVSEGQRREARTRAK